LAARVIRPLQRHRKVIAAAILKRLRLTQQAAAAARQPLGELAAARRVLVELEQRHLFLVHLSLMQVAGVVAERLKALRLLLAALVGVAMAQLLRWVMAQPELLIQVAAVAAGQTTLATLVATVALAL
jgi:hypothetical protein